MNYVLSDGRISPLPYNRFKESETVLVQIPEGAVVRRGVMWGNFSFLCGVQFFDCHGNMILEAGTLKGKMKDFTLGEGERLVGIKSKVERGREPTQQDVVFIIGYHE